ncbi:hypothetical protein [Aquimarina sp. MMG016]|uniref:hypothetical protein n=1 Tax=Aquimarina sp. MMG016 TaxID=2822690 RepID=UPI001B3A753A|nr:hypothetical protein [Aquimarina sp. MMG016]MBQ4818810.1 hypothetical protein [Aquimarina sp. MMG016]
MRPLILLILFCNLIACSGSKETTSTSQKYNRKAAKLVTIKNAPPGIIDNSPKTLTRVNEVLEKHTKFSLNDIARSEVIKTKTGYWWRFLNTRTGERFIVTTDPSFNTVNIQKKSRNRS